jgi:lipopolysaccharide biosynthesis glycosyltransferase
MRKSCNSRFMAASCPPAAGAARPRRIHFPQRWAARQTIASNEFFISGDTGWPAAHKSLLGYLLFPDNRRGTKITAEAIISSFEAGDGAEMPQFGNSATSPAIPAERVAPRPSLTPAAADHHRAGGETAGSDVHLLLCTNALYLQHVAVCLASLLLNNPDLYFDIVIVGRATERLDEGKLSRSLARFPNKSLSFREFTPPSDRLLPLNPRAHYTLDNWTRLWVEEFFDDDIERVLYLDADIVVVGSLAPLWHVDLEGALLGAVDIPGSDRGVTHLGLRAEDGYFNSGVLLVDLQQWRETRALATVLGHVEANPELMMRDVDQEALNACFHGRRKRLDYKWNSLLSFFREPPSIPLAPAEIAAVRREACVIHFNGNSKPWSYLCEHPRKAEYEKYLRMTEWRDFVPEDRTVANMLRKHLAPLLPAKIKTTLKSLAPASLDK